MNWNPYKRIADLETKVATLVARIDLLGRTHETHVRWVASLESHLQEINVQTNPVAAMTMGEFKKAKLREYARARYARKKAEKLAAKEQAK